MSKKILPQPKAPEVKAEEPKAPEVKAEEPKAPEVKAEEPKCHYICEGKSITSDKGILAPGSKVEAKDLRGGQGALDSFVKSGHIVLK